MRKIILHILLVTFFSELSFCQANFELFLNVLEPTVNDTLTDAQLFDFDKDGIDDFVFSFNNPDYWTVQVYNMDGIKIGNFSSATDPQRVLAKSKIFNNTDTCYLCQVYYVPYSQQFNELVLYGIKVYNLSNFCLVDSLIANPGGLVDPYDLLYINDLNIKNHQDTSVLMVSYKLDDYWSDIGGYHGLRKYNKTANLYFINSFIINPFPNNLLDNCLHLFPISELGFGTYSGWTSDGSGTSYFFDFYLYTLDFSNPQPIQTEIFHHPLFTFNALSSDDSTNFTNNIVFYSSESVTSNFKYLYVLDRSSGQFQWIKQEEKFNNQEITASANYTNETGHYVIYFSNWLMEIIRRENLELVHFESTTIKPQKILSTTDNQLFFIMENGTRSCNVFVLENIIFTDVENQFNLEFSFSLSQNYPNPFNPSTKIKYSVNSTQNVTLKVYDLLGREVATLVNEEKPAGEYEVEFNAENYNLSSGIYFYKLKTSLRGITKKMIYLR